jgi:predicted DNA-binding transcriptional regulator AlpA
MTLREAEQRQRGKTHRTRKAKKRRDRDWRVAPPPAAPVEHRDRVLSFAQWCALNGISLATGRRILNSGTGPAVLELSPRRIGIKESANAAWQQSRTR